MKPIAAVVMIVIMIMLSLGAFAYDTLNLNFNRDATTEEKMVSFDMGTVSLEKEVTELEGRMDYIYSQYGYDLKMMNEATLNELVQTQIKYATIKETLISGLNQIYFTNSNFRLASVEKKLNDAVVVVNKKCRVIDKLKDKCLDKHESLVFQAHYLKLQIEELDNNEDSLKNQINSVIAQENNSLYL